MTRGCHNSQSGGPDRTTGPDPSILVAQSALPATPRFVLRVRGAAARDRSEPTSPGVQRSSKGANEHDQECGVSPVAETEPMKRPLSRGPGRPPPRDAPAVSVVEVFRTLGLSSLRLKIVLFIFLSIVGALTQAILLLVISEVALADVEGKRSFHGLGPTLTRTARWSSSAWRFPSFSSRNILTTLVSTSVSEQALRRPAHTRRRVLPVQLGPSIKRAARPSSTPPGAEQLGHLRHRRERFVRHSNRS